METIISNQIEIYNPSDDVIRWVNDNLVVANPLYTQLKVLGKDDTIQRKHIPATLNVFSKKRGALIVPFGCLYALWKYIKEDKYSLDFNDNGNISIKNEKPTLPPYDYQEEAIEGMIKARGGILQAPCG
ncbi:MAG: hypothetical protein IKT40_03555 [Bacilli bacterium]|nr:hypothetical protein [Bacilli bacterium]